MSKNFKHFIPNFFCLNFAFLQLYLKIHSGMANNVDPDQTAQGLHCLHNHFVRNFGVRNFWTFTVVTYHGVWTGCVGGHIFASSRHFVTDDWHQRHYK